MAKENLVWLYGQVLHTPKISVQGDGTLKRGKFALKVARTHHRDSDNMVPQMIYDTPYVITDNVNLLTEMASIEKGDIILVKGTYATTNCVKTTTCPCGKKNKLQGGVVSFVHPIFIKVVKHCTEEDGDRELRECLEISNVARVIGNLCTDPQIYEGPNGAMTQYSIAVGRKYRIKEQSSEINTDFPWIKTHGEQALMDAKALKTGSCILIDGALQTRSVKRTTVCEHCGKEYEWTDAAMELVPYSIEYLYGHNTEDEIAEKEEENLREILRNAGVTS